MYYYNGYQCNIINEFARNNKRYAVIEYTSGDYEEHAVVLVSSLQVYEQTWEYKQREKRKAETKELEDKHAEVVHNIKNEAVQSLITRMKLNTVFGKDEKMNEIALALVAELRKLIEDKKL